MSRREIEDIIETSPRVDIDLKDGSIIKNVHIFKEEELYDSVVTNRKEIDAIFTGKRGILHIYFSSDILQGGISYFSRIAAWEFIEEE